MPALQKRYSCKQIKVPISTETVIFGEKGAKGDERKEDGMH